MRLDPQGWLVEEAGGATIVRIPTVRTTPLAPGGPRGLVWHATGGLGGPGWAEGLARRIQRYRRGVDRPASWHVLVARDGVLYQSAPLLVGTWHVGRPGVIAGQSFANVNAATVGVELENAGPLHQLGGSFYAWPYWRDRTRTPDPRLSVPPDRAAVWQGTVWDSFPAPQMRTAAELVRCLAARFRWDLPALSYTHAGFAAPRKTDPGRLWAERDLPDVLADTVGGARLLSSAGPAAGGRE